MHACISGKDFHLANREKQPLLQQRSCTGQALLHDLDKPKLGGRRKSSIGQQHSQKQQEQHEQMIRNTPEDLLNDSNLCLSFKMPALIPFCHTSSLK
mmetsp:Transcript_136530/g.272310  ORF Transcript_136530/g.272310 Transcript_136530/m.272310 type:complete len:97 (-) Transcript_136530:1278-1568(-)